MLALSMEPSIAIDANRTIDTASLDAEAVAALRSVEAFTGEDGVSRVLVGVRGDGCARLSSPQWKTAGADRRALIQVDVQSQ